jgi:hypothetical protein
MSAKKQVKIFWKSQATWKKPTYFFLFLFTVLISGCWSQQDVITIKSNGIIEFKSEVTITEKDFSTKDVDELTSEFMEALQSAGWQVNKKWISKSAPFKLSFSGKGNLHKIESASDFYRVKKIDEKTFEIQFSAAETDGGKSSRSIVFKQKLFGGAKVVDSKGKIVKKIQNVFDDKTYKIIL